MKKEAMLYEKLADQCVHCYLCAHRCKIVPSGFGICGVRQNIDGVLYSLVYGEPIAVNIDPIEKKPLYHFLPGSTSYSIATIGCNFKCGFCQNWQISQSSKKGHLPGEKLKLAPEDIVEEAAKSKALSISYTYTEPTIFFEYAYDTAKLAKEGNIRNVFVTNGYMTKEALDTMAPYLHAANVDLKSFSDDFYVKNCQGRLKPVLDSIAYMKELGIWVEITTLLIPGENDSESELSDIAGFIAQIGVDIPWHISKFHPDYQFMEYSSTSLDSLKKAAGIGKSKGLRYVYLGNVLEDSSTYCYNCNELLIKRTYLYTEEFDIKNNKCPQCGVKIEGIWE